MIDDVSRDRPRGIRPILVLLTLLVLPIVVYSTYTLFQPMLSAEETAQAGQTYKQTTARITVREKAKGNGFPAFVSHLAAPQPAPEKPPKQKPGKPPASKPRRPADGPLAHLGSLYGKSREQTARALVEKDVQVAKWSKQVEGLRGSLRAAIEAPVFVVPSRWRAGGADLGEDLNPFVRATDGLLVMGINAQLRNDSKDALDWYLLALEAGARLGQHGNLAQQRVALTVQGRAIDLLLPMLRTYEPDAPEARAMVNRLAGLGDGAGDLVGSLDEEYVAAVRTFERLQAREIAPKDVHRLPDREPGLMLRVTLGSSFMMEREQRLYTMFFLRYRPYLAELREPRGNTVTMDILKMRSSYRSELTAHMLPDFVDLLPRFKEVQSARAALLVMAGLAAYREERFEYPQRLQQLVPRYLKSIPRASTADDGTLDYRRAEGGYSLAARSAKGDRLYTGQQNYFKYQY